MRKLAIIALFCILLNIMAVFAVDCTDSDRKDDAEDSIGGKGSVTYGLTEKFDECVSNKDGYHMSASRWVREYYCQNVSDVIQRKYEDFDCERYGYTKCEEGKCIGKTSAANVTKAARPAGPLCGNHQLDSGEQCDPPDKICYDAAGNIGQCTRSNAQGFGGCQCKTISSKETIPVQNITVQQNQTAPEPIPAEQPPVQPEARPKEESRAEEPVKPAETAPAKERTPLPTEFEEPKGIGVTRGITNAAKRLFRWIGSWFD